MSLFVPYTYTSDFLISNQEAAKTVGKVVELSSRWLSTSSFISKKEGKERERKNALLMVALPGSTEARGTHHTSG